MRRVAFVALVFLAIGADDKNDPGARDLALLKGTWSVVSMIQDGNNVPNAADQAVTFDGKNVTIKEKERDSKGTCKLDATKDPRHIDLIPNDNPDRKLLGIYSLKGDELTICLAGGDRPTEFESKAGSRRRLVVLKHAKKDN